jgi:tryptophan-rich hypothetical protein
MRQNIGYILSFWANSFFPFAGKIFHHSETNMGQKIKFPHLVGSKWTAQQSTWGWRHFQVLNRKNEGAWVFAEMISSCDPSVRFWINALQLKKRHLWQAGWQTLAEIARNQSQSSEKTIE